jgi:hypothetical protein
VREFRTNAPKGKSGATGRRTALQQSPEAREALRLTDEPGEVRPGVW